MMASDNLWKLKKLLRSLVEHPEGIGIPDEQVLELERGLILKVEKEGAMVTLHAGREKVPPSDTEMDVLTKCIVEEFDPVFVSGGVGDEVHGRYVKRFLFFPLTEMRLAWKRPAVQMKIKI